MILYLIMYTRVKIMKFALLLCCTGLRTSTESVTKYFIHIQDSCSMPSCSPNQWINPSNGVILLDSWFNQEMRRWYFWWCWRNEDKFLIFWLKDAFFKTMSERTKLLEQTCDSNGHLRIAQINRNDFYDIHIKVVLDSVFKYTWHDMVYPSAFQLIDIYM